MLSEAKFDEKDADAMYDKYLGYAGVGKVKVAEAPAEGEVRVHGDRQEAVAAKTKADSDPAEEPSKSSVQHAREMEKTVEARNKYPEPKDNYPFDDSTYEFLGKHKDVINSAASKFGVSPEAVAGAIGDEFNRSGFGDKLQDQYIKLDADLTEVEGNIREGYTKGKRNKTMLRPAAHDIGPGNMNVTTLHGMFVDRFENGDNSDKLKQELSEVIDPKASREDQWKQYVEYATTPEGTANLSAAHMEDAAKKLEPHMEGLSQEEKDAVLVTYYKQGPSYLDKYKKNTAKKAGADSAESNRPIKPGEGTGLLYQINKIRSALGK